MSISLLTNQSATLAMNNLSSVADRLQTSLNRLSSGNKIIAPSDDAGGLAVSMKMTAAIKRQVATNDNLSNTMSFLQTQDGALDTTDQILNRIGELKTLSEDVTKNSQDKLNYNTEFLALRDQISALSTEKFNGIDLFGSTDLSVKSTADGSGTDMEMSAIDLLGADSVPFEAISDSFDTLDNFTDQSQGTASVDIFGGTLNHYTGNNDIAQVDTVASVSGSWEMNLDFSKTDVENDDFSVLLGGSEIYSYDAEDTSNHSLRIVFNGSNTADIYMDGSGTPSESNAVATSSGNLALKLTSTVSGASVNVDNFDLSSTASSNNTGSIAVASSLDAVDISTIKEATQEVASFRAQNGAQQSRLSFAQDMLVVNKANLEAANSRIMDVDIASESTEFARLKILQEAATSMLSQANQTQQTALKLIG